jgi:ribosome-associated protein
MQIDELVKIVNTELDFRKAERIEVLHVKEQTSIADAMMVVTAASERHARSLSDYVIEKIKEFGLKPLGREGEQNSDWVLLDLGDLIIHIMTAQARERYQLEKLWSITTRTQETARAL